jgi:hypothetical protein
MDLLRSDFQKYVKAQIEKAAIDKKSKKSTKKVAVL